MKQEEAQRLVVIRDVETQRNRIARVAADTQRKVKLTEDDVAFKHVIVQDLKRTRKEVVRRYNDFQQLYQLVKNQRNKFVSLVAVAGQGIGEFKEKVKILTNELEVSLSSLLGYMCGIHSTVAKAVHSRICPACNVTSRGNVTWFACQAKACWLKHAQFTRICS